MESFATLMFSDAVKAWQARAGTKEKYEQVYDSRTKAELGQQEIEFIESSTFFYLASVNNDGWPYAQHRGGPVGFLKVLGPTTIGFADYVGNKQFVSAGNIDETPKVSMFLIDYPRKARLKVLGHAKVIEASEDEALANRLSQQNAPAAERLFTIEIEAMDWNCPKYIIPKFDERQIDMMLGPKINKMQIRIQKLEGLIEKHGLGAELKDIEGEKS